MIQQAKEIASHPNTKRGFLAGGVSFATLAVVYQLFTTQDQHERDLAQHWQEIKTLEVRVDELIRDVVRLEATAVTINRTNP